MSDETTRAWWADPRVLLVLALLSGTGVGGGASAVFSGSTEQAIAELKTEVVLLRAEVKSASSSHASQSARLERDLLDHEERLRRLERAAGD